MSPMFSVVIPLYNRADLIEKTIRSILDQTCQDFEIVIADDGSTDDPEPRLKAIGDPRIRYLRQENAGGGAARNLGITNARGEYIALLDSDDAFLPEKLSRCLPHLPLDDRTVLYSALKVDRGVDRFWVKPERGIRAGEDVGEYLFCANQVIQTSTIVLRTRFAQECLFDPTLRRGQDLDFCVRLQRAGATFRFIEEPLTIWLDNSEAGRTSYVKGYETSLNWLNRSKAWLTPKAVRGYRATVLAYHLGHIRPFTALRDILLGWALGGVSLKTTLRQMLRAFLPRSTYRRFVNSFVSRQGKA